jgi:hypothetical protein
MRTVVSHVFQQANQVKESYNRLEEQTKRYEQSKDQMKIDAGRQIESAKKTLQEKFEKGKRDLATLQANHDNVQASAVQTEQNLIVKLQENQELNTVLSELLAKCEVK